MVMSNNAVAAEVNNPQLSSNMLHELETLLLLTYDDIASGESKDYFLEYNKKLVYIILKVVEANKSITVNQVCGLLRNTLQIPDHMTKTVITTMLSGIESIKDLSRVIKAFPSKHHGALHLSIVGGMSHITDWTSSLIRDYPELSGYKAPIYQRGPIFKLGD